MQGTYSDREQMLRRSIRDIIALSALPALWKSQTPADLAQNLVDAVCSALDGDCSCIRFKTRGGGVIFVASTAAQKETLTAAMLADRLAAFLEKSERWVGEAPNPVGPGQARIAVVPLESGRLGALVVTSTRPGFPDETGHLLLGLAGTQVSLLLDRAEAIQAISENEQRLRLLIEQSPLAILTFSPDGRAIGANPAWARLWETVPEAVAGYNLLLDAQLEAKGVMPLVQEAFEGRSVHIPRLYYDAAQGGTGARARWIDTHIYPIKDSAGSVLEIVMMLEDVTDGVRLEQQLADMNEELEVRVHERTAELEAANREMETFTYTVAHDLRSPLRAIVATSMILKEDFIEALPMDARPELESQARAAKRLGILIDELLKLSRLGREPLNRANVDISKMCSDVVAELRGSGHGTVCTFEIEPQMTARADPDLLKAALTDLLSNACKFSPRGGRIRVGTKENAGKACFFVQDEGIGFDMKYAHKLFLPFEKLVLESDYPGTGIGLAHVKRIIDRHGGRVWAESKLGEGSTFHFTLC